MLNVQKKRCRRGRRQAEGRRLIDVVEENIKMVGVIVGQRGTVCGEGRRSARASPEGGRRRRRRLEHLLRLLTFARIFIIFFLSTHMKRIHLLLFGQIERLISTQTSGHLPPPSSGPCFWHVAEQTNETAALARTFNIFVS